MFTDSGPRDKIETTGAMPASNTQSILVLHNSYNRYKFQFPLHKIEGFMFFKYISYDDEPNKMVLAAGQIKTNCKRVGVVSLRFLSQHLLHDIFSS